MGERARILAAGAAFPEHRYEQSDLRDALRERWGDAGNGSLALFDRAGVRSRRIAFPLDYYFEGHGFARRNRDWAAVGIGLAEEAARSALAAADVDPSRIGHLFFVTTTGLATPSLDAPLAAKLGLPRTVLRTPIFGVGCAGGAVGISRAAEWARANPDAVALLVSVELCSQTFLPDDRSPANLVGTALFGDAAAAAVLAGPAAADDEAGLEVVRTASELLPDSHDLMGWDFLDEGFRLVLSKRIPKAVRDEVAPRIRAFLGTDRADHFILHPGGPKVLRAYEQSLDLTGADLRWTEEVLAECGNLSSATVLVALSRFLAAGAAAPGETVLLSAVGPGFAVENVLLRR